MKQKIEITRDFRINKHGFYEITDSIRKGAIKEAGKTFGYDELFILGLEKHSHSNLKSASGTNFNEIYKNYSDIYNKFSLAEDANNLIGKHILKISKENKLQSVIDIGCGTGKYISLISKYFKKAYALDNSNNLLNFASSKAPKGVTFLLSGAESVPLLDDSVELSYSTWASFSPNEAIQEMIRITKNSGYIIMITTAVKDDLTSLYSKYDEALILKRHKYLQSIGFSKTTLSIDIKFKTLTEARNILSTITGCNKQKITDKNLKHEVAVFTLKVEKLPKR